jgi:hypothetical protein
VIKLQDFFHASGKKRQFESPAIMRFLWGNDRLCGCWLSLNSDKINHQCSIIFCILSLLLDSKNRFNPQPKTAIVGILCLIEKA